MKGQIKTTILALSATLAMLAITTAVVQAAEKYSFHVVPQFSATVISKDWEPMLARLSRDTGVKFELKVAASIPDFEAEFLKGAADFAYMNPYHMVMAKEAQGYVALVRNTKPLTGILLAKKDGPYKNAQDLDGQLLTFPSPNAFGASLYMRALLTETIGIQFDVKYVKTHPNVYRHVLRQQAAAGGSVTAAFGKEKPEVKEQLSIIYKTPDQAPHPIAAHPRVPEDLQNKVSQALLDMANEDMGLKLLTSVRLSAPVLADYEQDYYPLELLGLKKYLTVD